jgi:hypothetical protein
MNQYLAKHTCIICCCFLYIYAKIISIHYTYTYRFIQIHIHTQTYCIIGRFVYSFWKQFGFTVNHPVWLHDYIVTVGQPWISISMPWSESIEFTLNVNCTFDNIAFNVGFLLGFFSQRKQQQIIHVGLAKSWICIMYVYYFCIYILFFSLACIYIFIYNM